MNKQQLQTYIEKNIPLTKAMQVSVNELSTDKIELTAPLKANFNHRGTAFGGSLMALQALAGWGYLMSRLTDEGFNVEIVIHKSEVDFSRPVTQDFLARCLRPPEDNWQLFADKLRKKKKARISLNVEILQSEFVCCRLNGSYVVVVVDRKPV